jgi:hypothetical protein
VPSPLHSFGRLLVFETQMQVDAFLNEHEVFDYSAADFEQDCETLRESPNEKSSALSSAFCQQRCVCSRVPTELRICLPGSGMISILSKPSTPQPAVPSLRLPELAVLVITVTRNIIDNGHNPSDFFNRSKYVGPITL